MKQTNKFECISCRVYHFIWRLFVLSIGQPLTTQTCLYHMEACAEKKFLCVCQTHIHNQVAVLAGPQESLLAVVMRRKLAWFGHVTLHNTLSKTVLQETVGRRTQMQRQTEKELDRGRQQVDQA